MQVMFQRNVLVIRDDQGNVLRVVREKDGQVLVYLNGHLQGGLEDATELVP